MGARAKLRRDNSVSLADFRSVFRLPRSLSPTASLPQTALVIVRDVCFLACPASISLSDGGGGAFQSQAFVRKRVNFRANIGNGEYVAQGQVCPGCIRISIRRKYERKIWRKGY